MIGFGQEWEKTFGFYQSNQFGSSVQQTADGGYIITGYTELWQEYEVILYKIDANGIMEWDRAYDNVAGTEMGLSVQQTTDGGYIITGYLDGNSGMSASFLIKTDGLGIEQWNTIWQISGVNKAYSGQQTTDGGYIFAGHTDSLGSGNTTAFLNKTDGNGIDQWYKTFGGSNWELSSAKSVQQTNDGGYVITGTKTSLANGDEDVFIIKINANGNTQWRNAFGGTNDDEGHSVQQTTDGGYIITGFTKSFGNLDRDVFLIKTDGLGIEQWSRTLGGTAGDYGYSVQQTTDGGYIIAGQTGSFGSGDGDVYLIKTDGNGIGQWYKTFGGTDTNEYATSVQQTTDGGYVITGREYFFDVDEAEYITNVILIKTNGNGIPISTFNIPINPNRKLQKTVDMLGKETKPKPNTPLIEIYDDGTVEKRIVIE
tara:strand:+ start:29 stop:1306 length:1278 start_codon:yes stop_codon:yes gene_type:complete